MCVQECLNGLTISDTVSPNKSIELNKSRKSRKLNKTPVGRYVKNPAISTVGGISKLYKNQVPLNYFSGLDSTNSSNKKVEIDLDGTEAIDQYTTISVTAGEFDAQGGTDEDDITEKVLDASNNPAVRDQGTAYEITIQ